MTTIILADDHKILRQGVKALLESVSGWKVIAQAGDGLELVRVIEQNIPDILVLDLSMPNLGGIETIVRLKRDYASIKIIILSGKDDEYSINEALKAGALCYVIKDSGLEDLVDAVQSALNNQPFLSEQIKDKVNLNKDCTETNPLASLSAREREIMKLLAEGNQNREVAKLLYISTRTIDSHRSNILKKLGVTSNAELVQIAYRYGLIE